MWGLVLKLLFDTNASNQILIWTLDCEAMAFKNFKIAYVR